jgi:hypothetical protein
MAENLPESGPPISDALAARLAAVRAANAASARQPAPPPDEMASPWRPPTPSRPVPLPPGLINSSNVEKTIEAIRAATKVSPSVTAPKRKETKEEPEPISPQIAKDAWEVLDRLLSRWSRQIVQAGRERANFDLARALMSCGASLLRARVPVEAVASIVRLSNELAEAGGQIDEDDKRINELRRQLRSEVFDTATSADSRNDEREEAEEDGD